MKKNFRTLLNFLLFIVVTMILATSCKKDPVKELPTITVTSSVINITSNSAIAGGEVLSDGGAEVTSRGVCWSRTNATPTIEDNKTINDGVGLGVFTCSITGLYPATTYYLRAFATNSVGTAYYSQTPFKTASVAPLIVIIKANPTSTSSIDCEGYIERDGGSPVTSRGFCWSKKENPTIEDSKTSDGSGIGNFTSTILGLTSGTIYYVRAYATNNAGIGYGNQVERATWPSVTTMSISSITSISASGGGIITSDANLFHRGICWSTTSNPTVTNSTYFDSGYGSGNFTCVLNGLKSFTKYYVRAFSIIYPGSQTIAYGNEVSFTSASGSIRSVDTVTDIDGNDYHTVIIGTQIWMVENLKVTRYNDGTDIRNETYNAPWLALKTGAYCYYNNDAATYKATYGALYNWYAVITDKLAPMGWHLPTIAEWRILTNYLGGEDVAGGKLKEAGTSHWGSNTGTNETGFSALPGGYRSRDGSFIDIGYSGKWWCSNENYTLNAWYNVVHNNGSDVFVSSDLKSCGYSVRCIKDN